MATWPGTTEAGFWSDLSNDQRIDATCGPVGRHEMSPFLSDEQPDAEVLVRFTMIVSEHVPHPLPAPIHVPPYISALRQILQFIWPAAEEGMVKATPIARAQARTTTGV